MYCWKNLLELTSQNDVKMFSRAATQSSSCYAVQENKITTKWGRIKLVRKSEIDSTKLYHKENEKKQIPFHCQCNTMLSLTHLLKLDFLFS